MEPYWTDHSDRLERTRVFIVVRIQYNVLSCCDVQRPVWLGE
jgi:hypothetical protein